jgi:hypothetical protein
MGVDQGKELHVVIGKKHDQKMGKIAHLGIYRDWNELDALMKNFRVERCVVDALPETRNARAFAERHRGKVFLNYYNDHQKGSYAWNEKELIVSCNRTESLDASHREISERLITLPREFDLVRTFAQHLHNVAKRLEEDEDTGSKRYVYVKLGPDHFRHAFNYESMARQAGSAVAGILTFMENQYEARLKEIEASGGDVASYRYKMDKLKNKLETWKEKIRSDGRNRHE